jgi:hypothetical protein
MRTISTLIIGMCFALTPFSPAFAQQSGGLKIMDADSEGMCKDEPVSTGASKKNIQRQAELARELSTMLKRTAEIQKKLAAGAGKDVQAELSRMIERTGQMTTELQAMADGAKTP